MVFQCYSLYMDTTEMFRRSEIAAINSAIQTDNKEHERIRLREIYGEVWDTPQLGETFDVVGFLAPYCQVVRKSDGVKGFVEFQHSPRFYFNFRAV